MITIHEQSCGVVVMYGKYILMQASWLEVQKEFPEEVAAFLLGGKKQ